MKKFKIKSFCKVNLSLKILKKLENGYHNIESLITFCELHDLIFIRKIKGINDKINFSGKFRRGISKNSNTIIKVLHILRKKKFINNQAFSISVRKNIPHGSGLGGGSSNAASLLNFFNSKMNLNLSNKELAKIARKIGFDVPICLGKNNLLLTGKKENIIKINKRFNLNILIVYPNIVCPTKKIYKKNKNHSFSKHKFKFNIKDKQELIDFLKLEGNDLEKTVVKLYPKIKDIIDFIKMQKGCHFSRITGSGSACIGIFSDAKTAIYTKKLIRIKFSKCWCVVSKTI